MNLYFSVSLYHQVGIFHDIVFSIYLLIFYFTLALGIMGLWKVDIIFSE